MNTERIIMYPMPNPIVNAVLAVVYIAITSKVMKEKYKNIFNRKV